MYGGPGFQALGACVQAALADAVVALMRGDLSLADHVVRADLAVNQLRYTLEEKTSEALTATADPIEVRRLVATLYVLADLERIGDHAEGIAKVALMLGQSPSLQIPAVIGVMSQQVQDMVRRTLSILAQQDVAGARRLCEEDDEIDALYDRVYGELLMAMAGDRNVVSEATYLLWVTHNAAVLARAAPSMGVRRGFVWAGQSQEANVSNY